MGSPFALELKGITKTFGSTIANKDVDLQVKNGEILSILGENGSGKTTLMNMVSGIYYPDSGEIYVGGKEVVIKSPGREIFMARAVFSMIKSPNSRICGSTKRTRIMDINVPRPKATPMEATVGSDAISPIKNPAQVKIVPEVKIVGNA